MRVTPDPQEFMMDEEQLETAQELSDTPDTELMKVYHIEDGPDQVYEAKENEDGSFTVYSENGDKDYPAEQFNIQFLQYTEPSSATQVHMDLDRDLDDAIETGPSEERTPIEQFDDLDEAQKEIIRLRNKLDQQNITPPGHGTTPEHRVANAAESLINGLANLSLSTAKGIGTVLKKTASSINAWQAKQEIQNLQDHVDAVHSHLDAIKEDPDYIKEMMAIDTGVKSKEDVRQTLYDRFTSEDSAIQGSDLNKSYLRFMNDMHQIHNYDFAAAEEKIDLTDKKQDLLLTKLRNDLARIPDREEMDILPNSSNEDLKEAAQQMIEKLKEFFQNLVTKLAASSQAHEEAASAVTP